MSSMYPTPPCPKCRSAATVTTKSPASRLLEHTCKTCGFAWVTQLPKSSAATPSKFRIHGPLR